VRGAVTRDAKQEVTNPSAVCGGEHDAEIAQGAAREPGMAREEDAGSKGPAFPNAGSHGQAFPTNAGLLGKRERNRGSGNGRVQGRGAGSGEGRKKGEGGVDWQEEADSTAAPVAEGAERQALGQGVAPARRCGRARTLPVRLLNCAGLPKLTSMPNATCAHARRRAQAPGAPAAREEIPVQAVAKRKRPSATSSAASAAAASAAAVVAAAASSSSCVPPKSLSGGKETESKCSCFPFPCFRAHLKCARDGFKRRRRDPGSASSCVSSSASALRGESGRGAKKMENCRRKGKEPMDEEADEADETQESAAATRESSTECACCLTGMGTAEVPAHAFNCGHCFCNRQPPACVSSILHACPLCAVPITTRTRLFFDLRDERPRDERLISLAAREGRNAEYDSQVSGVASQLCHATTQLEVVVHQARVQHAALVGHQKEQVRALNEELSASKAHVARLAEQMTQQLRQSHNREQHFAWEIAQSLSELRFIEIRHQEQRQHARQLGESRAWVEHWKGLYEHQSRENAEQQQHAQHLQGQLQSQQQLMQEQAQKGAEQLEHWKGLYEHQSRENAEQQQHAQHLQGQLQSQQQLMQEQAQKRAEQQQYTEGLERQVKILENQQQARDKAQQEQAHAEEEQRYTQELERQMQTLRSQQHAREKTEQMQAQQHWYTRLLEKQVQTLQRQQQAWATAQQAQAQERAEQQRYMQELETQVQTLQQQHAQQVQPDVQV